MCARRNPYDESQFIKGPMKPVVNAGKNMVIYSVCDSEGHCDRNKRPDIRCIEESKGIICLRRWEYRPDKEYTHPCNIPPKNSKFTFPDSSSDLDKKMKDLKRKFHIFIAKSTVSYAAITDDSFFDFFYTALQM
jgi:hypothetical protein